MHRFIARHAAQILGVLSGFDRLVLRGTLRNIAFAAGFEVFLSMRKVLLKNFGAYVEKSTAILKAASLAEAKRLGRPIVYLPSGATDKEAEALKIADRDGIKEGLIAVITCVEPCQTFEVYRNRDTRQLDLVCRVRKCLHLYHYFIDARFGLMNMRIQTWFPFTIQVCLNGREWLSRQMDGAGLSYERRDNCFTRLARPEKAQALMDQQLKLDWVPILDGMAHRLNPAHTEIFGDFSTHYYWSVHQSEWATDVMFQDETSLAAVYEPLVLHGITTFRSPDVMRFLGQKVRGAFSGEIRSSFKDRREGVRIKHTVGVNSVKLYDKGSVLRTETTLNDTAPFKVFRPKEGAAEGPSQWRRLRKGIADLYRRTQLSQGCNDRYLDALAAVKSSTPLGTLIRPLCRPATWKGKRARALRPWDQADLDLLQAISRGEFNLMGFRNRDLQALLYTAPIKDHRDQRRRSARVSRLIRLLRAHGLIRRLGNSYRYKLTAKAHDIIPAVLAAQRVTLEQLQKVA